MGVATEIEQKLTDHFAPTHIVVVDESAMHAGHSGAPDGGESHFRVEIEAADFGPMSRIARHRAVHDALGKELVARIHALGLHISG